MSRPQASRKRPRSRQTVSGTAPTAWEPPQRGSGSPRRTRRRASRRVAAVGAHTHTPLHARAAAAPTSPHPPPQPQYIATQPGVAVVMPCPGGVRVAEVYRRQGLGHAAWCDGWAQHPSHRLLISIPQPSAARAHDADTPTPPMICLYGSVSVSSQPAGSAAGVAGSPHVVATLPAIIPGLRLVPGQTCQAFLQRIQPQYGGVVPADEWVVTCFLACRPAEGVGSASQHGTSTPTHAATLSRRSASAATMSTTHAPTSSTGATGVDLTTVGIPATATQAVTTTGTGASAPAPGAAATLPLGLAALASAAASISAHANTSTSAHTLPVIGSPLNASSRSGAHTAGGGGGGGGGNVGLRHADMVEPASSPPHPALPAAMSSVIPPVPSLLRQHHSSASLGRPSAVSGRTIAGVVTHAPSGSEEAAAPDGSHAGRSTTTVAKFSSTTPMPTMVVPSSRDHHTVAAASHPSSAPLPGSCEPHADTTAAAPPSAQSVKPSAPTTTTTTTTTTTLTTSSTAAPTSSSLAASRAGTGVALVSAAAAANSSARHTVPLPDKPCIGCHRLFKRVRFTVPPTLTNVPVPLNRLCRVCWLFLRRCCGLDTQPHLKCAHGPTAACLRRLQRFSLPPGTFFNFIPRDAGAPGPHAAASVAPPTAPGITAPAPATAPAAPAPALALATAPAMPPAMPLAPAPVAPPSAFQPVPQPQSPHAPMSSSELTIAAATHPVAASAELPVPQPRRPPVSVSSSTSVLPLPPHMVAAPSSLLISSSHHTHVDTHVDLSEIADDAEPSV